MRIEEYLRHRDKIRMEFKKDMNALRIIYPEEWKKDHAPKGGPAASKGAPRSGHRVGAKISRVKP